MTWKRSIIKLKRNDLIAGATNTFTYTGRRLTAETQNGAVLSRFTDAAGRPSGIALNGFETRYGYDSCGRLSSVTGIHPTNALMQSRTNELFYTYLPGTDLISGHTAGALSVTRAYEPRRDLIAAVSNSFNGITISAFNYVNDALGRRVSRADSGLAFAQSQSNAFAYNARSEITGALLHTNAYGYVFDSIGNRLAATANGAETTYTANALNQYTAVNTAAPQYDADGNMTALGDRAYTYDAENRMTGVSLNGIPAASYTYDHQHRRVRKATPSAVHDFVYDGWNLLRETVTSNGAVSVTHYIWGLDLSGTLQGAGGVGGLLATVRDDGMFFPCYDANGNVTEYIDESGAVRAHYEYSPFGEIIAQSGDLADTFRFRFSTKYHDPETGHYYYGRRFYSPELGRWLNRDPIEESGGLNLYGFIENNPVDFFDVLGLSAFCDFCCPSECNPGDLQVDSFSTIIVPHGLSPNAPDALVSRVSASFTITESIVNGLSATVNYGPKWGAATAATTFLVGTLGIDPAAFAMPAAQATYKKALSKLGADIYTSLSFSKCTEKRCLIICKQFVLKPVKKDSVEFGAFVFTKADAERKAAEVLFNRIVKEFGKTKKTRR